MPHGIFFFPLSLTLSLNRRSQEKAAKWKNPDGHMDGLTTNGVLVMHPRGGFTEESRPGVWREISVCGDVYTLRETRSAQTPGKLVRKSFSTSSLVQNSAFGLIDHLQSSPAVTFIVDRQKTLHLECFWHLLFHEFIDTGSFLKR